jgi:hypothetical protein
MVIDDEVESDDSGPDARARLTSGRRAASGTAPPVSDRAYDLIVRHETGGRAYYEQVYKGRPVWPEGQSGITIGFGYDLGYVSAAKFQTDWSILPRDALKDLLAVVGKRTQNTPVAELQQLVRVLRHISIPWDTAEAVFRAVTLPDFRQETDDHLPNCALLSPGSFGALVSLTFNRGASYARQGERYREMRAIKAAMAARAFDEIPASLRAMKRIWIGTKIEAEMTRRRGERGSPVPGRPRRVRDARRVFGLERGRRRRARRGRGPDQHRSDGRGRLDRPDRGRRLPGVRAGDDLKQAGAMGGGRRQPRLRPPRSGTERRGHLRASRRRPAAVVRGQRLPSRWIGPARSVRSAGLRDRRGRRRRSPTGLR